MKKYSPLVICTVFLLFLSTSAVMAQNNAPAAGKGMQKKASPFLIVGKLPHLTKLLMQQWDNPELKLTDTQKQKLSVIKARTLGGVRKLGPQIATLERQVADEIFSGETPEDLSSSVQSIAELKSQATMLHLRCIFDTNNILNSSQRDFLKAL